ncbi:COG4315 family predicted lipoprotein [Arenimonas oryziterrae]|uniref:Lipoprotein n=1 Tax=Arenimonas oryziterrae DSM 21050 = YC6267 TaxID=1121015 RepID=A0A091ANW5_9GAMM|nr:hypothetical protein [Arenimonas oryziterrae]KFN41056.1 hypothetical protein N789_04005 [Arenimonas oryziterrae DSM 21050 = YC6267]
MHRKFLLCLILAGATACLQAAEPAPGSPPIRQRAGILVDIKGRGLYTFDGDKTPGRSSCNNQCRLLWPPILAEADAQPKPPFTLVVRDDGTRQWAYRGKPLYRWASDYKRGDAGGDGVSGVWHLVRVTAAAPKPATTTTPARADGQGIR